MNFTYCLGTMAALLLAGQGGMNPVHGQAPDEALAALTEEIANALYKRGNALLRRKSFDRAIADYTEAIAYFSTPFAGAYVGRGSAYEDKKEYQKAIEDFTRAAQIDPNLPHGFNNLAWLLATCPDAKLRDGKKAIEFAVKACQLTGYKDAIKLDTLAAAYAAAGQFDNAVKWQKNAVDTASKEDRADRAARLELYKAGKPYQR